MGSLHDGEILDAGREAEMINWQWQDILRQWRKSIRLVPDRKDASMTQSRRSLPSMAMPAHAPFRTLPCPTHLRFAEVLPRAQEIPTMAFVQGRLPSRPQPLS
jgi:hypothetical protein